MNPTPPTPSADHGSSALHSTLQSVSLLIGSAASLLTPLVHWSTTNPLETWATALVAVLGWFAFALVRSGHTRFIPHLLVFGVLSASILAVLAHGSVRTAGGFLFVAAVAGAGILLGRNALMASVAFSVASLAALTYAERSDWLHTPNFEVGFKVWLTHSATLTVVAILVYYSRLRAQQAATQQLEEYERRKRTEQERDRNLERFARIFHNSPSPMIAQSAHSGVVLDVNPAFERCYGYTKEQLLGRVESFLWADPAEREAYALRLFSQRSIRQHPALGQRADGSTFHTMLSSELSDDREDKLIITTVTDVSVENEALVKLQRSEERFAKAFNFSPLKMTITRLSDGKFVEVNQARDPVQGLGRQDLIGRTTLDTGGWLSPQERHIFISRIQREGHLSGYETRMRHADGQVIDAKMWAELIEIDGEDCILSCFVNTTEEKRREALLLSVAQGMTGQTGEAFFKALTQHMAQSLGADMVIMGELRPDQRMRTLSVWSDGTHGRNFTFSLAGAPCGKALDQTGLCVHTENVAQQYPQDPPLAEAGFEAYVGQSLRDDTGEPIGVLNALWKHPIALTPELRALMSIFASRANAELLRLQRDREIQRLNETLEQRVRERTADLQKLNAELDSFAYSVSHDLKSPLRTIDGFTRLLDEQLGERLSSEERSMMQRVLAATHRMSGLIADLLALARVSQGALSPQRVDLSTMAHEILDQALEKQPERRVERRISPGLSAHCDERLARIALENLLNNALKYSRNQPLAVIEMGQTEALPGTPATQFVRDNGVGFDMAYADKLFKPFQRLHLPSEFEGTGIGLATVRRIIERHGGDISASAVPHQGACFMFTFQAAGATPAASSGLAHTQAVS